MIDLSYLTEEEHGVIMEVLKRDAELKKAEVQRVQHLHDPEEDKLKYITGEWFYEMKSQRHQDRIHGSDLIMASINQKKPMTVESLTQSRKERSIKSVTDMPPKPETSDSLMDRGPSKAQQDQLNWSIRSQSRPRHNPFNALPMDVDLDFTDDVSEAVRAGSLPSLNMSEAAETDTKVFDALQETALRLKPVPKRRTKLYNLQDSVGESTSSVSTQSMSTDSSTRYPESTPSVSASSESRSTVSNPGMSTNSGIRSPPPRGLLKHSSSGSSSDFKIKSQLPQPLKQRNTLPTNTSVEQFLEENTISKKKTEESSHSLKDQEPPMSTSPPKSALPKSRLPLPVKYLEQTEQEKPTIQPRLSLKSKNDQHKTTGVLQSENDSSLNSSTSAKAEDQKILNKTTKELQSIPRIRASSPFEALLDKPLSETPKQQIPPKKLDTSGYLKENESKTKQEDHPQTSTARFGYIANNKENSSQKPLPSPLTFNKKTTEQAIMKAEDSKQPVIVDSQCSKSPEKGESIAKVLEWFSKSTDSSDFLDYEDDKDNENYTSIEDLDFEEEINPKPKPENNVYLIIPRQRDGKTATDSFLNDTELKTDLSVNEQGPFTQSQYVEESPSPSKSLNVEAMPDVGFSTVESVHPQNASPKDKVPKKTSENESTRNVDMVESTDNKICKQEIKKKMSNEERKPPKLANLRSFWEKGTTEAPRILVSRTNLNSEREKPLNQHNVEIQVINNQEEPSKVSTGSFDLPDLKKQTILKNDKVEDAQPVWSGTNEIKDIPSQNSTSDTDVSKSFQRKLSLSLQDNKSVEESQRENIKENVSVNDINVAQTSPASPELKEGTKTKEKELQIKSSLKSDMQTQSNPLPLPKQTDQQQDNRTERIKDLKSFWEQEKRQPRIYVKPAAANGTKSSNLSKRFTKSEYDLSSIGTELEEDERGYPNFTVLPLQNKVTTESINSSQFKSLLDFWAGSSNKPTPAFKSKMQRPLSHEDKHAKDNNYKQFLKQSSEDSKPYINQNLNQNQLDKANFKGVENDSNSESTKPLNTERTVPTKTGSGTNSISYNPEEPDLLKSSPFTSSQKSSDSKDSVPSNSPGTPNKESHQKTRRSMKGLERDVSLRRAKSMFAINMNNEDEASDVHVQPENVPDTSFPQAGKTKESSTSSSRKTSETNSQVKKSPEINKNRQKSPSHTSEDSNSQPLARSFVSRDYQHYLGITENTDKYVSPQDTDDQTEFVCTPFTSSEETGSLRCSSGKVSTPLDSPSTWKGSLGPQLSAPNTEDVDYESSILESIWSQSRASPDTATLENPVQVALERASFKTAYHKSLEDITAIPRQPRKINQADESWPECHEISSTPSPPSSFLDRERMKKLSKSVPYFLDQEDDEGGSDSFHSGMSWRNSSSHTNLSSNLGMASSVSGSVTSVSSGDFQSVEVQGIIQFSLNYVQKLREFHIFVVQCKNLAAVDAKRNRSDPYVKSYLMPDSASLGKRKTSVKKKTLNPMYNEILRYRVPMSNLKTQTLNLSVWHNDTFGRNSFLGETEVDLSTWDFETTKITNLSLKPRATKSIQPADIRGEMRLAIRFLPQISHYIPTKDLGSGEVHIWVKDCNNLPLVRGTTVDPYVKCFVLPDTSKKSRQKTRVLKRTANPVFNHTMVYDGFRAEDLKEACVELTVWDRDRLGDHLIGGIRLGLGKGQSYGVKVDWMDSCAEEAALWQRMMDSPNNWVEDVLALRVLATSKNKSK